MVRTTISKVAETLFLSWGYMYLALVQSALGPSLLDIQLLIDDLVNKLPYVFMASGMCVVIGNVLAAFTFSNINLRLKLAIFLLLGSIVSTAIAAVNSYPYFLIIFSTYSLCGGFISSYLFQVCNTLWQQKGVAFQFIAVGGSLGAIIAPVIVKPFLCTRKHGDTDHNGTATGNTSTGDGSDVSEVCQAADTQVQYAYIVLGLVTIPCGIAFLYFWNRMRTATVSEVRSQYETLSHDRHRFFFRTKLKYAYMVVLFLFEFPVVGNQLIYVTYLTVFGVDGPLHISKDSMVDMTSLLFVAILAGNVVNSLLLTCYDNFKIVFGNLLCLVVTGAILICLADTYEPALWISTIGFGLFCGTYECTAVAWTETFMEIDVKVITVSRMGIGIGITVIPFLGGMLYSYKPPMGHLYLIFAMVIFMCIMFLLLNVIGRCIKMER